MVMRKNIMAKNLTQSILKSLGRYIAIVTIIALGAAMFVGLRTTKSDMIATGQRYFDQQNFFNLRLLNTYGWTQEHVDQISAMEEVDQAEGVISLDAIVRLGEGDGLVYKLYSIPQTIDQVYLVAGRLPEGPEECVIDAAHVPEDVIGAVLTVSSENEDTVLESLRSDRFTVVGLVNSPLYLDLSRGTTSLGNGSVSGFVCLPEDAFDVDYFSEIVITLPQKYDVYTDEFNDAMEAAADTIKPRLEPMAQDRYRQVREDAEEDYAEGLKEYQDGYAEFLDAQADARRELAQARRKLEDGQREIDEGRQTLADSEQELIDGQAEVDQGLIDLGESRQALADAKSDAYAELAQTSLELLDNYETVMSNLQAAESGLAQIDDGLQQLNDGISQIDGALELLNTAGSALEDADLAGLIAAGEAALEQARENGADEETLSQMEAYLDELRRISETGSLDNTRIEEMRQEYTETRAQLVAQRDEVQAQRAEVVSGISQLEAARTAIESGRLELDAAKRQADSQFAALEAQIVAGEVKLENAQRDIDNGYRELEDGKRELEQAEADLAQGWQDYRDGELDANRELSDARMELLDAANSLREARKTIDELTDPTVYALGRNTNVGYLALDSNSDIVAGVSRVFPAFFLLVAALVCITTMTRMVEEERTQIGTMKALGYSNAAIIGKYLAYAGSAAILGCGLGVLAGSVAFPNILWQAYQLILNMPERIDLHLDVPLCLAIVIAYTAVSLAVTWYCCRMALREVPAELMRPRAPTTGKKIFLEYLPFWDKIRFLNKVMFRNIFRYRQRLLMMLAGIGGCTALLVTGFGIRDSIVDIVAFQYEQVTVYDLEVRFDGGLSPDEQRRFQSEMARYVDEIGFFHQSSVELDFDDHTKDINLLVSDGQLADFMNFHAGDDPLSMPGTGEALLSVGAAEDMGVKVGDTVTVRNADMESLDLRISGIFDNHVYNYIITNPETVEAQWGSAPEVQMACITVREDQDAHYASTRVTSFDGVMQVTVSQDLADQVTDMLSALDLVVVTVVICAALLAITVLYNLTNINIAERIREIATIKVLGFTEIESAAYVFKENLLLSAMGAVLGLFGGKLLLDFVMSQIKVEMVWFLSRVSPMSYVWSVVLTMLSACVVDFIFYFKLERINMAEALKSVE